MGEPLTPLGQWEADLEAEARKPGPTMTITKAQYAALRAAATPPTPDLATALTQSLHEKWCGGGTDHAMPPCGEIADRAFRAARASREAALDDSHEHWWVDAPDDEMGWHCVSCGRTEYPGGEFDPEDEIAALAATESPEEQA